MFSIKVQKAHKAQKDVRHTTFFILDVFMRTKIAKSTKPKALLLLLRGFMRTKMLSFLFAYVRFVLFVPNNFFLFDVLCAFKTVFVFICLCAFYVFYACEVLL